MTLFKFGSAIIGASIILVAGTVARGSVSCSELFESLGTVEEFQARYLGRTAGLPQPPVSTGTPLQTIEAIFFDMSGLRNMSEVLASAITAKPAYVRSSEPNRKDDLLVLVPENGDPSDKEGRKKYVANVPGWLRVTGGERTPFGEALINAMRGKIVFDLGCGLPSIAMTVRILAQIFKSQFYVGVDLNNIKTDHVVQNEFPAFGPRFSSFFFRADMLDFLRKLENIGPSVFIMMGIEADIRSYSKLNIERMNRQEPTINTYKLYEDYFEKFATEIARVTRGGDTLVMDELDGSLMGALERHGFARTFRTEYQSNDQDGRFHTTFLLSVFTRQPTAGSIP